ncbi:MAG: hypothetical protein QG594_914 [Bacteroidota bacterium]|nr:hypothetical protein [Bacteroidota bacterium]
MKNQGICKLCQQYRVFVKSHIIPRACYKDPYRKSEPLTMICPESTLKPYKNLNGVYAFFLCDECEKKFSTIDSNGLNILYRENFIEYVVLNPWNPYQYYKIYETFDKFGKGFIKQAKLFVLSILWRAAVSNRKEFNSVKLDKDILEQARQVFFNNSHELLDKVDIAISKFTNGSNLFIFPVKEQFGEIKGFRISLPYYTLLVKIDDQPFPSQLHNVSLNGLNTIMAINRDWNRSAELSIVKGFWHQIRLNKQSHPVVHP